MAIAAFIGIVFGAMGGRVALVVELAAVILIAVGVWRAVDVLVDIHEQLSHRPRPRRGTGGDSDSDETVRIR